MVGVFEGNKAETTTIAQAFRAAHQLTDGTVVADAGMVSAGNQQAIEDAGLSFIFGARIPNVPCVAAQWRREHPGEEIPDGYVCTQAVGRPGPVYHRKGDSIQAHLTIVLAALAVSHWIETTTGWSIKKFVRTGGGVAAVRPG